MDSDKCNGCGECIKKCPQNVLALETVFVDLEDKTVAAVTEQNHKKIKYTCAPCKPETGITPCTEACEQKALKTSWKTT